METATNTISGIAASFSGDLTEQLWEVAPYGVGAAAILFGVPLGIRFLKKLAK